SKIITNSFTETMLEICKNRQKLLDILNENYLSNFKYRHILRPTSFYSFISVRSWQHKEYINWDTYWNKIELTLDNQQVNCFSKNAKKQIVQYEIQTIQKGLVPLFYRDINT
ncbi:lanthionine synthetase, partial [Helicobacter pylori]